MMTSTADFLVGDYGGMWSLTPMTHTAREACEDGTSPSNRGRCSAGPSWSITGWPATWFNRFKMTDL